MPKVSVTIASYNHAKYIRECLQSVLDQTYQDFEIIITDDGSSDRSVEIIKEFNDPRINLFVHTTNKGACITLNNCCRKATGEYIAVLNSDDVWNPTKLEQQVTYLDSHQEIGAVFTKVSFVDELSRPIEERNYKYYRVFEKENRTRFAWLYYFFYMGNCLCHPSVLIRNNCYDDIGLYDERMANIPDLDMWVRLCLKYEIHILEEKLVKFRILDNESNASGDKVETHIRANFEFKQILNHYLEIKNKETFLKIFPEAVKLGNVESEYVPYFLSMLALEIPRSNSQLWGLEILNDLLGNYAMAQALENNFGFRYLDFNKLTAQRNVFSNSVLIGNNNSSTKDISPIFAPKRNGILKVVIKLHWILANLARKYILK